MTTMNSAKTTFVKNLLPFSLAGVVDGSTFITIGPCVIEPTSPVVVS